MCDIPGPGVLSMAITVGVLQTSDKMQTVNLRVTQARV